jgi:hypothetical protein
VNDLGQILCLAPRPGPVFVNLLRSPGIDSRPGVPVRQSYLTYRPSRLNRLAESIPWNQFLGSLNVYKYGICFIQLLFSKRMGEGFVDSIKGLFPSLFLHYHMVKIVCCSVLCNIFLGYLLVSIVAAKTICYPSCFKGTLTNAMLSIFSCIVSALPSNHLDGGGGGRIREAGEKKDFEDQNKFFRKQGVAKRFL